MPMYSPIAFGGKFNLGTVGEMTGPQLLQQAAKIFYSSSGHVEQLDVLKCRVLQYFFEDAEHWAAMPAARNSSSSVYMERRKRCIEVACQVRHGWFPSAP